MSILFSRRCEYAIQAVMYLSLNDDHAKMSIRELTKKLSIPHPFLAKILQDLTRKGLLESQKGVKGGFTLTRAPHEITLLQIIEAIDGPFTVTACSTEKHDCDQYHKCSIRDPLWQIRERIAAALGTVTLAEMAADHVSPAPPTAHAAVLHHHARP